MIDAYETSGEEKIVQLPNPLDYRWQSENQVLSPAGSSRYTQTLDFRSGVLMTQWENHESTKGGYRFSVATVVHPKARAISQRFLIENSNRIWRLHDTIDAGHVSKDKSDFIQTKITSSPLEELRDGQPFWRTVVLGEGSAASVFRSLVEYPHSSLASNGADFEAVLQASKEHWRQVWKTDIEIDGPVEDQQAIRSFLFYLQSAIQPEAPLAVSPFGLSHQQYNGHVFWDADIWVAPALALLNPDCAAAIASYRLARLQSAEENFLQLTRSTGPGSSGNEAPAIKFPWESSVSGAETAPGQFREELHIVGDVAFSLTWLSKLDLVPQEEARAILERSNKAFQAISTRRAGKREILQVMSPDEGRLVDNDLFTNLLAQWCQNGGSWSIRENSRNEIPYRLPRDERSLLTYDQDSVRGYKQAATVLAIYPLQFPEAVSQALVLMERFASKVTKNGPAMSDSIHALIHARHGDPDVAYRTWRHAWKDFTRSPLLLFSEKRSKPITYFTTGAAGCLQTILFGFAGIGIDEKQDLDALWSKKLLGGSWMNVRPRLPAAWKAVKLKNLTVLGRRLTFTATRKSLTVTQGAP